MPLQSRISKLEAKLISPSRRLTWVDLMKLADGEDIGFEPDPNDPIWELFKEETEEDDLK